MNRVKLLLTLMCAFGLSTVPPGAAEASIQQTSAPQTAEEFAQTRDRLLTKAASTPLNADEHFSLATSLLGLGQFRESLIVAKLGLGLTQAPVEKSLFYMAIAQCHGARGFYDDAADAALEGQRLDPLSRELAALRFVYFTEYGDLAQAKAAEDNLRQLVPGIGDQPIYLSLIVGVFRVFLLEELRKQGKILLEVAKEEWPTIKSHIEVIARDIGSKWLRAQTNRFTPAQ